MTIAEVLEGLHRLQVWRCRHPHTYRELETEPTGRTRLTLVCEACGHRVPVGMHDDARAARLHARMEGGRRA